MSIKLEQNFYKLLNKDINISSYVITENLETIHRFNIVSRFIHRNELDSQKICKNIETTIKHLSTHQNSITPNQRSTLLKNLEILKRKFSMSSDQDKQEKCTTIIGNIRQIILKNFIVISDAPIHRHYQLFDPSKVQVACNKRRNGGVVPLPTQFLYLTPNRPRQRAKLPT